MEVNYYIADVFTKQTFSGAQIAVFPEADGLNEQQMALIANEMNLSETAFVLSATQDSHQRTMRVFSPLGEIDFAGHPIIAAAYVLAESGGITLEAGNTSLVLKQKNHDTTVNITSDKGKVSFVQFTNQVEAVIDRFTPSDNELAECLSLKVNELDKRHFSARLVSCGFPYLIIPVWQYESVRKAKFNYAAWSQSTAPQTAAQEIILFAPKSPYQNADFNVRLLGSNIGIRDDPPVGSAMPAFASYLCSFDFTQQGTHVFSVDRGDDKCRRSVINIEMDNKAQGPLTLRIGGEAVIVAKGTFYL